MAVDIQMKWKSQLKHLWWFLIEKPDLRGLYKILSAL